MSLMALPASSQSSGRKQRGAYWVCYCFS